MSLVEYHDPDGLFPLVAPKLQDRLPLRNLHWKSPSRPLRSIASLNVDFVPAGGAHSASSQINGQNNDHTPKPRKHQIPGLRATPFLKLLILRCDDKDSYKATKQQQVKDWLQTNVPSYQRSSSASKQENHDAFEWLILHVVVPGTQAATQPRWSKSSSDDSEPPKEKTTSSKWPGRGSSTILEKLRSDFNSSSKSSPDRIAQVRLQKEDVPGFTSPSQAGIAENPQDVEHAWADLVGKFKTLILIAFGARVGQYEDDVREREAQQSLPGWNFCTFFVLKEGLLRALESVGLIEDALIGYDELAAGLDSTIGSISSDEAARTSDSFLDSTQDLHDILSSSFNIAPVWNRPLSGLRKDYRHLIANNNISVFDFRSYIFARQMGLLLHLVNPAAFQQLLTDETSTTKQREFQPIGSVEDAFALADLLQRAGKFVTGMARLMRDDLDHRQESAESLKEKVDRVVYSWAFATAHQILEETSSPSFPQPESRKPKRIDAFPHRRSSLTPVARVDLDGKTVDVIGEEDAFGLPQNLNEVPVVKNVELASAAALRADLFMVQRRMLEHLAFLGGLTKEGVFKVEKRSEKDLSKGVSSTNDVSVLNHSLSSLENFRRQYQNLTDRAIWYFLLGGRRKSAERLTLDLATLKYHEGDFASASSYFTRLSLTYANKRWTALETSILKMHAECLRALNRKDEHIRVVLALIAKSIEAKAQKTACALPLITTGSSKAKLTKHEDVSELPVSTMFKDIVDYTHQLTYDYTTPLDKYFPIARVSNHISHFTNRDGFSLDIRLMQNITDELTVDLVSVRLVGGSAGITREMWLESQGSHTLGRAESTVTLESRVSVFGSFIVDKIKIMAGKLAFVHDVLVKPDAATPLGLSGSTSAHSLKQAKGAALQLWPRKGALTVSVQESSVIHVGSRRSLELTIDSNESAFASAEVIIRPATAGLRLHPSQVAVEGAVSVAADPKKTGCIRVDRMQKGAIARLLIPYDTEMPQEELVVKLEIQYATSDGDFTAIADSVIDTQQLLSVNTRELFKHESILSSVHLRAAVDEPLKLLANDLGAPVGYKVMPVLSSTPDGLISGRRTTTSSFWISRSNKSPPSRPVLQFKVEYVRLRDAISRRAGQAFVDALQEGGHGIFEPLLQRHFVDRLRVALTSEQVEEAEAVSQVVVPDFDDFQWKSTLDGLHDGERKLLETWLQDWHQDNVLLRLRPELDGKMHQREMRFDFSIPRLQRLYTTAVGLRHSGKQSTSIAHVARVGDPLVAEVRVKYTARWATGPSHAVKDTFICYLKVNPATWGVVGPKQRTITLDEGETESMSVTMVPLTPGVLAVPSVAVTRVAVDNGRTPVSARVALSGPDGPYSEDAESFQTDCLSQNQTITIIESMKSTTVGAGHGDQLATGLTLLESEPAV